MQIICIGQAAYDITLPIHETLKENQKYRIFNKLECMGGPAANASYLCAKWDASTILLCRLGDDLYGHKILRDLKKIGVDTQFISIQKNKETPLSIILNHTSTGDRTILNNPGEPYDIEFNLPQTCDVLLMDAHELDISLKALETYKSACSILDAGTCRENTLLLAGKVDYLICSQAFASVYTKENWNIHDEKENARIFYKLKELNKNNIIITLGEHGLLFEDDNKVKHMNAFPMDTIDTTGAGDIFHGAFAYAISKNYTKEDALYLSSMASALSVTKMGGQPSIPNLKDVISELRRRRINE